MRLKRAIQYVVVAPHEPAALARATATIAHAGVPSAGVTMTKAGESLLLRFAGGPRRGLKTKLESQGLRVHETPVLELEGDPTMVGLDRALAALAARGINIDGCHRGSRGGRATWVLSVDKLDEAARALEEIFARSARPGAATAA